MSYLDALRVITYEAGVLLQADRVALTEEEPHFTLGYILRFEKTTLYIGAKAEDDTVMLSFEPLPLEPELPTVCIQNPEPWTQVYGHSCLWGWLLINQQGYEDGIRLQFTTRPEPTFIELIVSASTLHCRRFKAGF